VLWTSPDKIHNMLEISQIRALPFTKTSSSTQSILSLFYSWMHIPRIQHLQRRSHRFLHYLENCSKTCVLLLVNSPKFTLNILKVSIVFSPCLSKIWWRQPYFQVCHLLSTPKL
jgi:hypothetical protein